MLSKIKNLCKWFKIHKDSYPGDPYYTHLDCVIFLLERFIKETQKRDSHYVGGEKKLRGAKILLEVTKRIRSGSFYGDTVYSTELECLRYYWDNIKNTGRESMFAFTTLKPVREDCFELVQEEGVLADRYRKLKKLHYKVIDGREKTAKELFNKHITNMERYDY